MDSGYLDLAKRKLSKYNVNFYCEDSIAYIEKTEKRYSVIVSDNPTGGDCYKNNGAHHFRSHMVNHVTDDSVIVFNYVNKYSPNLHDIEQEINIIKKVQDIFMVVRNEVMSYILLHFKIIGKYLSNKGLFIKNNE